MNNWQTWIIQLWELHNILDDKFKNQFRGASFGQPFAFVEASEEVRHFEWQCV